MSTLNDPKLIFKARRVIYRWNFVSSVQPANERQTVESQRPKPTRYIYICSTKKICYSAYNLNIWMHDCCCALHINVKCVDLSSSDAVRNSPQTNADCLLFCFTSECYEKRNIACNVRCARQTPPGSHNINENATQTHTNISLLSKDHWFSECENQARSTCGIARGGLVDWANYANWSGNTLCG